MFKRTVVSAFACMFISSAYADYKNSNFDGWYVGAFAGGSFTTAKESFSTSLDAAVTSNILPPLSFSAPINGSPKDYKNSLLGELLLGYGHLWDNLYLGAEGFINLANYKMSNSANTSITENFFELLILNQTANTSNALKLSPVQFGLRIRPGILLTPNTLLFAQIGATFANMKYNINSNFAASATIPGVTTATLPFALSASASKRVTALALGFGVEQNLSPCLALRMDYLYTYYGKLTATSTLARSATVTIPEVIVTASATATATSRVKVSNNAVMFGLIYHFAK